MKPHRAELAWEPPTPARCSRAQRGLPLHRARCPSPRAALFPGLGRGSRPWPSLPCPSQGHPPVWWAGRWLSFVLPLLPGDALPHLSQEAPLTEWGVPSPICPACEIQRSSRSPKECMGPGQTWGVRGPGRGACLVGPAPPQDQELPTNGRFQVLIRTAQAVGTGGPRAQRRGWGCGAGLLLLQEALPAPSLACNTGPLIPP